MTEKIFETALGIAAPWYVAGVDLDAVARTLTIRIDFVAGSRFAVPGVDGAHPVHDTQAKRLRHLNFFQHECYLEVRVPRVKLPGGAVRQVEPEWVGRLSGFTLLFEALVLALCQQMTFTGVARLVNLSLHRVMAICSHYVEQAVAEADFSEGRAVIFVTEGRGAETIEALAADLQAHGADPHAVESVSIDMSPAFIKGVGEHLPNARITFDKFHVVAHASTALDRMRRLEQKNDPDLNGLRWTLLKNRQHLTTAARADLDAVLAQLTSKRTARAWLYREQLREILQRKQVNVVRLMLAQWCTNVMRSKVAPMKDVAHL